VTTIAFDNQVAVVTGCGRGLGRAYALELARRGAAVIVNDVDAAAAASVVGEIKHAGGRAVACRDSVSTSGGGHAIVETAIERFGGIHAVIHNAGITRSAALDKITDDDLDEILDVHLRGAFNVLRPAWPTMQRQGYGRIALASSSAGLFGRDGSFPYSAAKGALFGLGRALAHDGARYGIVVNSFLPLAQTLIFQGTAPSGGPMTARIVEQLARLYEIGLPPDDVVPLVVFLVSSSCTSGGHAYWACGRGYAEVFTGLTDGWWPPRTTAQITAEDVAQHLPDIERREGYRSLRSIEEELDYVLNRLTSTPAGPSDPPVPGTAP
jgi:NAD(P)-dependent dehydrogenase (short-subunit alcohol dehydrogenase family)